MSIRYLALELYRLEKDLEALRKRLASASLEERAELDQQIKQLTAERDRQRAMLEAKKEPPPYRRSFR
ncbi:MAG: hypothetical protein KKB20_15060 [Proteobacteria bacterium]|nr:hypothetical protein [Pseudomonadota bacterium]